MSQRDVLAELRTANLEAPPELRARVRLIASEATPPRRRASWKLGLAVALPVAAAVAGGIVLATRPSSHPTINHGVVLEAVPQAKAVSGAKLAPQAVPASPSRLQQYSASLTLRVATADAVSNGVQRALRIAASFGGFPVSVHVSTTAPHSAAQVVLKVPRMNVQAAIAQLSQLGAITSEQVDIQDLQSGVNATDRTIARLQTQIAALRAQPQTDAVKRQIAALTAQVVTLQRARAATARAAHFASVRVALATPPPRTAHHHYLRDALPWLGGAAAALVVLLALRALARLREARLLSRS